MSVSFSVYLFIPDSHTCNILLLLTCLLLASKSLDDKHNTWSIMGANGRQNNGKKDGHVLILGTCKYIALYGKMDFADVIKLRTWTWSNSPGFSKSNLISWVLKKENLSQLWSEKCNDGKRVGKM